MQITLLHINWQAYLWSMFIFLFIYYSIVLSMCFGTMVRAFRKSATLKKSATINIDSPFTDPGDQVALSAGEQPAPSRGEEEQLSMEHTERSMGQTERVTPAQAAILLEEVTILLEEAGKKKLVREELIQSLQSLFHKNEHVMQHAPEIRTGALDLTAALAEYYCSIQFSSEELEMLWGRKAE